MIPGAYSLETRTVVIPDKVSDDDRITVTYARVSSSQNKKNLKSQSERLASFCMAKGWEIDNQITEVGSGMNDKRVKLLKLLGDDRVTRIVVEHKDRLARFGVEYIKTLCENRGCELVIVNDANNDKEDIMQDFVSIITSFCAKIYGHRRSRRKTEQIIGELEK